MLSVHRLLFWPLMLALLTASWAIDCGNDYNVREPGKDDRCIRCGNCHPGYGRDPRCGTVLKHPPMTSCKPCQKGTYSDKEDRNPCKACHQCAHREIVTKKCTNTSNTVCSGKCEAGYYHENASHDCQKCSHCCNDGNDKVIEECTTQGMPRNEICTIHNAKRCNPTAVPSTPTTLQDLQGKDTRIYIYVIIGVSLFAGALLCIVFFSLFLRYKRRSQRNLPEFDRQNAETNINISLPDLVQNRTENPGTHPFDEQNGNIPAEVKKTEGTKSSADHTTLEGFRNRSYSKSRETSPKGTPSPTDDEMEEDHPPKQNVSQRKTNTADAQKVVISREISSGSTGSQEGEERRSRLPSFQDLSRKLSRQSSTDARSLLEEKEEESTVVHEEEPSIAITRHPESKVITEGEKLELICEATGPQGMSYQWLKNKEKLLQQTGPTLIIQSAKVRDFGRYVCCVSTMKTETAEIGVLPRQGTRYKRLVDVDIDKKETICLKLDSKRKCRGGLGGWKQVARKYSMNQDTIDGLNNTENPSEHVLEYLGGRLCHLTVYDFCKSLTEPNIMRNDVVSILLGDLTEPEREDNDML